MRTALNRLSIGAKQGIGFGFILVILTGVNVFSLRNMALLKADLDVVTMNWLERVIAISELNLNTSELRRNQLAHAYSESEREREAQEGSMINLIEQIDINRDVYESLRAESEVRGIYSQQEQAHYEAFDERWDRYQGLTFEVMRLLEAGRRDSAIELLNGEARQTYTAFREDLRSLVGVTQQRALQALARADDTFFRTYVISISLLVVTLLISGGIAAWLVHTITQRVSDLSVAARRVARGDLGVRIGVDSSDEIGHLAQTFNQMTVALGEYRDRTEQQAAELRAQQEELSAANGELAEQSRRLQRQKMEIVQKNVDLQEALEKLRTTQEQLILNEKMASLGNLVAGVAHEINNPINFVSSNISPLRRDVSDLFALLASYERTIGERGLDAEFEDAARQRADIDFDVLSHEIDDLLDGIQEGAKRTAAIVKGLRNFSRLDEDELRAVDVNEGIESTLLILHNEIKRRIEIVKDLGDLPTIQGYPGRLNQVFMNVLTNAIQAIEGSGTIWIRTRHRDDHVEISIRDSGSGMTDEVKNKIFEPFFTTKEVGMGTGLGLSISFGIIEDHQGRIEAESRPGAGTEFTITLPVRPL